MSYEFPKIKLDKNGLFGPTRNGNYYNPVVYHNRTAAANKHKTTWALKQNEQYHTFRVSDEAGWICTRNKGLFSILENGNIIMGNGEERLSFFPHPLNHNEPYHGYPVNSGEYEPSVDLVDKWLADNIIDNRIHIKILKGQI